MNEIWKEIVGFSGYYVSSLGRVKHVLENGHEIILKLARNTMVQIHKRRGENLNISIGKLMYYFQRDRPVQVGWYLCKRNHLE